MARTPGARHPGGKPITPEQRAEVIRIARTGIPRNKVAEQSGVSRGTVSKICAEEGITFNRAATQAATTARKADLDARTAEARLREMSILEYEQRRFLDVIEHRATFKTRMKGAGGAEYIKELDFIPAEESQKLATARGSMQATIARMAPKDTETRERAISMLDKVIAGLGVPDE